MAEVLLFHHAHGLTPGVIAFADILRDGGHTVHTPDLYRGELFADLADGMTHATRLGMTTILRRAREAAEELPTELVYAGFSLGAWPAQSLTQTRPGARGALLYHACAPTTHFSNHWPSEVPVQIHAMEQDPFFVDDGDGQAARDLIAQARDAKLFLYPGSTHLFADSSLPSYDSNAADRLIRRTIGMLDGVDSGLGGKRTSSHPSPALR